MTAKKILLAAAAVGMLATTAQPAAAQARVFTPSSAWVADFGDDYCRLARTFTDGKDEISLAMERIQPSVAMRLVLVGNSLRMFRGSTELEFTLAPSGGDRKGPFWRSQTTDGQQYLNLGETFMTRPVAFGPQGGPPPGPPPAVEPGQPLPIPPYDRNAEKEFASGVDAIVITKGLMDTVRIETGDLRPPVDVIQHCADDLLTHWGLDAAKHQTMTRPAQPATEANKWLPSGVIGFGDFGKLGGAANQVRVMVGADGKPTGCAIHWPSLTERTNNSICNAIMSRGEFFPALDAQGQPMASFWTVQPFFLMPPFGR